MLERKANRFFALIPGVILLFFTTALTAAEPIPREESISNSSMYLPHAAHGGMWMFEYMFMRMYMSGMLAGSNEVDPVNVLQNPQYNKLPYPGGMGCTTEADIAAGNCKLTNVGYNMTMDMHMFMVMYHQTADLSYMLMFNYLSNSMDMYDRMDPNMNATSFPMSTSGLGDVRLFLTKRIAEAEWYDVNVTLGINLPFGSIDEPDGIVDDMTGSQGIAPYDMQLGSGTYDLITSLDLEGVYYRFEYGGQVYRVTRTGQNAQHYNMGYSMRFRGWGRYTFPTGSQLRGGIIQRVWSPIEGRDMRMSDNTKYSGGKRLELIFGAGQKFKDYTVYLDYYLPIKQYLNGVQMKTTGMLVLGIQYMYM